MSLISRFINEQGKILSKRVNKLTLKQQRLDLKRKKKKHDLNPILPSCYSVLLIFFFFNILSYYKKKK